jgi:ribose transport system permease protein
MCFEDEKGMKKIKTFLQNEPQTVILIVCIILFYFLVPNFGTKKNLMNILKQNMLLSIASCGLALVVIGGNLDLSIGGLYTLCLVSSVSMQLHSVLLALIVPLAIGVGAGFLNGYVVGRFKVNSIIVTLGTGAIFKGIMMAFTKGNVTVGLPGTVYSEISNFRILNLPFFMIVYFLIAIIYQIVLGKTKYGRALQYQGVNHEAAYISGIKTKKTTIISFVILGGSIGLAAILMGSRMLQANTIAGQFLHLEALPAILIGGISLGGGVGSIYKAMIGVFLLAVILNALTLLNVHFEWRTVVQGLLILLALFADVQRRQKYNE